MPMLRYYLIAAVMTCFGISWAFAQTQQKDPRELMFGTNSNKSRFNSKSAKELMSQNEYAAYRHALETLAYKAAGRLLNSAFIRQYPQFAHARLTADCASNRGCRYWTIYANSTFKEYGFCRFVLELKTTEHELRQNKLKPPKYILKPWPHKTKYSNNLVWRRDEALAALIGQAELNYKPALIKLAALIRRGNIFNANEETEYFLLMRSCPGGVDCKTVTARLIALRRLIGPVRAAAIQSKALPNLPKPPRIALLLLGEKL